MVAVLKVRNGQFARYIKTSLNRMLINGSKWMMTLFLFSPTPIKHLPWAGSCAGSVETKLFMIISVSPQNVGTCRPWHPMWDGVSESNPCPQEQENVHIGETGHVHTFKSVWANSFSLSTNKWFELIFNGMFSLHNYNCFTLKHSAIGVFLPFHILLIFIICLGLCMIMDTNILHLLEQTQR